MVKGLDRFRTHFRGFVDRYVLIGGTACDLIMNDAGLEFRATKDLDIVLCLEALDETFAQAFWVFVNAGEYEIWEAASGEKKFYRFQKPAQADYPVMLELFSRVPDILTITDESHLTPIPISDEVSSLSAILLDPAYYGWIQAGRREIGGLPVVGPEHLVLLKAKAWLDLTARSKAGAEIRSSEIKKHKNDIFRLLQVLDPELDLQPSPSVANDFAGFLDRIESEGIDLHALGLRSLTLPDAIAQFRRIYRIA